MNYPQQHPPGQHQYPQQQAQYPQQQYPQHPGGYQAQFQHAPAQPSGPIKPVRTPPAIVTPFLSIARELRGLFAVPLAFIGGLFGSIILSAALVFVMWWLEENAHAAPVEDDDFELEFEPGTLTKLGVEPKDIPEKPINEETRTPEDVQKEAVTEEDEPPPPEEKEKKPEEEKPKEKTPINKNKDAKISDKNRTDNNPYKKDLPNNLDPTGDPFGDPQGWSDLRKDGDPWATAVMAALNNMKVPAWAGKLPPGANYKFTLRVCKNGTVDNVSQKGSTGNKDLDAAVRAEILRLKFPAPPSHIARNMRSNCVTLRYTFSWTSGSVR
jgi:outer membrane biosynthesis protein TonB